MRQVTDARPSRREINVRERLPGDLRRILHVIAWGTGVYYGILLNVIRPRPLAPPGLDSHAYWRVWHGPMYTTGPMTADAYLYSPAFAQAIWPAAAHLAWPVFGVGFALVDAALLVWLLWPLGWSWIVPLFLTLSPEILEGNIFIPLATMCVLGFRYPGAWALSALTKVAPTVMPVWWLARKEWRAFAGWAATTLAIIAISAAVAPDLWVQWVGRLVAWAGASGNLVNTRWSLALVVRAPLGLALLVVGARKDWRWSVPVAALLCTPVFWLGSYAWLAAIPRAQAHVHRGSARPQNRAS